MKKDIMFGLRPSSYFSPIFSIAMNVPGHLQVGSLGADTGDE